MDLKYRRVDQKATPVNVVLRREILKMRDIEKLSWRAIAARLNNQARYRAGGKISFQRVCQLYAKIKRQTGVVKVVKNKEVISEIKIKRTKLSNRNPKVRTQDLTPEAIDKLIDLDRLGNRATVYDEPVFELRKRQGDKDGSI